MAGDRREEGSSPSVSGCAGRGNVEAMVPFIVEAESSNFDSFGRVTSTAPLTVLAWTAAAAGRASRTSSTLPLTLPAETDWRAPWTRTLPLTLCASSSPSKRSARTSPLTV